MTHFYYSLRFGLLIALAAVVSLSVDVNESVAQTGVCCCPPGGLFICIDVVDVALCLAPVGGPCPTGQGAGIPGVTCADNPCFDTPVELVSYSAFVSETGTIDLIWETATETNNSGFYVERMIGSDLFETIGFVEGHGTTIYAKEYSFTVSEPGPGLHTFRLKQVDYDGAFEYVGTVEALVEIPSGFVLEAAYPNPFNPTTTLRFGVAVEQPVKVVLYDALGKPIRLLFEGTPEANSMQEVVVNADGLPSGAYVVRLEGASFVGSQTIAVVK